MCLGPFGAPRPWGVFECTLEEPKPTPQKTFDMAVDQCSGELQCFTPYELESSSGRQVVKMHSSTTHLVDNVQSCSWIIKNVQNGTDVRIDMLVLYIADLPLTIEIDVRDSVSYVRIGPRVYTNSTSRPHDKDGTLYDPDGSIHPGRNLSFTTPEVRIYFRPIDPASDWVDWAIVFEWWSQVSLWLLTDRLTTMQIPASATPTRPRNHAKGSIRLVGYLKYATVSVQLAL